MQPVGGGGGVCPWFYLCVFMWVCFLVRRALGYSNTCLSIFRPREVGDAMGGGGGMFPRLV